MDSIYSVVYNLLFTSFKIGIIIGFITGLFGMFVFPRRW